MKTISIQNGDLHLDASGNISMADGIEGLRQCVVSMLRTIKGEWILDVTFGIPYKQEIFIIGVREAAVRNIYDRAILEFKEVINISHSAGVLDRNQRRFGYAATVETIYGKMEIAYNG
jgi:hypothetical protein